MRRLFLALATLLLLVGCGTEADGDPGTGVRTVSSAVAVDLIRDGYTVIDVRTAGEYEAGHVAEAQNIDVNSPGFAEAIGQLDTNGKYIVYCRSGNRSAQAASQMKALGFTNIADAGGFDSLKGAGAPTA